MSARDPNGFLLKFEDGPLAKRSGLPSLRGPAMGVLNVPAEDFSWPLPDLLAVAENGDRVAIWDAVTGYPRPEGAVASVFYRKVGESALEAGGPSLIRGAFYRQTVIGI